VIVKHTSGLSGQPGVKVLESSRILVENWS